MNERGESVLRKVRALRELAKSSNIHEAEAAAAQADALIQKYRLDEAELEAAGDAEAEAIGGDHEPLQTGTRLDGWKGLLAAKLARHYGCYVYTRRFLRDGRRHVSIQIVGRPSDVATVRYMFAWLVGEIARLSAYESGTSARNAFRLGAVTGIGNALYVSRKAAEAEHARTHGGAAAIVLVSRADAAKAWASSAVGGIGAGRAVSGPSNRDAFLRGKDAGEKIHVGGVLPAPRKMLGSAT